METTPDYHRLPRYAASPEEILRAFRLAYPFEEVQAALRQHLQPEGPQTPNLPPFYEHLEMLLSAVYQLPLPAASPAPLAEALDALSQQVSHDWVLLICPPE